MSNKALNSILFVCLGNICRSPLAEGIAKKISTEKGLHVKIDSAGTGDWHEGETPCQHSISIAKTHNLDISMQRARQIKSIDLDNFFMIIALDEKNYSDLKKMGAKNLYKLGHFGLDNIDIPDPYFFPGFEGFEKVYSMIETAVSNLLEDDLLKKN
ncbi:MAG: low molecular weight protein-tyrosine-phosphatase [Campylobacterota bacterium]|nr:low molecular weight protein-tyrosine-phosphatase [Campylobacterota bacterium]